MAGALAVLGAPVCTMLLPLLVPGVVVAQLGYLVSVGLSSVFAVMATFRVPRSRRRPWTILLWMLSLGVVGEVWFAVLDLRGSDQWPSGADVVFIASYLLMAYGVLSLTRQRSDRPAFGTLLDAAIVTTGVGVLALIFVIGPLVADGSQSVPARVVGSLYPLIDVVMVYLLGRALMGSGRRDAAVWWICLGILVSLIADTVQNVMVLTSDSTDFPSWMNLLWALYYVSIGAGAAAARSDPGPPVEQAPDTGLTMARLVVLAVGASVPALVQVLLAILHRPQNGVQLSAGSLLLLVMVLTRVWNLLHQVRRQADQMTIMARTDPLTGVANRRSWDFELDRDLTAANRMGTVLLVALLDVDHFKRYNDEYGHQAGDELLQAAAQAWARQVEPGGWVARWGGEEFAVALHSVDLEHGLSRVDSLRSVVPHGQTCSIGVAQWDGSESTTSLLRRADEALYEAKASGRNRTVLATPAPPSQKADHGVADVLPAEPTTPRSGVLS